MSQDAHPNTIKKKKNEHTFLNLLFKSLPPNNPAQYYWCYVEFNPFRLMINTAIYNQLVNKVKSNKGKLHVDLSQGQYQFIFICPHLT